MSAANHSYLKTIQKCSFPNSLTTTGGNSLLSAFNIKTDKEENYLLPETSVWVYCLFIDDEGDPASMLVNSFDKVKSNSIFSLTILKPNSMSEEDASDACQGLFEKLDGEIVMHYVEETAPKFPRSVLEGAVESKSPLNVFSLKLLSSESDKFTIFTSTPTTEDVWETVPGDFPPETGMFIKFAVPTFDDQNDEDIAALLNNRITTSLAEDYSVQKMTTYSKKPVTTSFGAKSGVRTSSVSTAPKEAKTFEKEIKLVEENPKSFLNNLENMKHFLDKLAILRNTILSGECNTADTRLAADVIKGALPVNHKNIKAKPPANWPCSFQKFPQTLEEVATMKFTDKGYGDEFFVTATNQNMKELGIENPDRKAFIEALVKEFATRVIQLYGEDNVITDERYEEIFSGNAKLENSTTNHGPALTRFNQTRVPATTETDTKPSVSSRFAGSISSGRPSSVSALKPSSSISGLKPSSSISALKPSSSVSALKPSSSVSALKPASISALKPSSVSGLKPASLISRPNFVKNPETVIEASADFESLYDIPDESIQKLADFRWKHVDRECRIVDVPHDGDTMTVLVKIPVTEFHNVYHEVHKTMKNVCILNGEISTNGHYLLKFNIRCHGYDAAERFTYHGLNMTKAMELLYNKLNESRIRMTINFTGSTTFNREVADIFINDVCLAEAFEKIRIGDEPIVLSNYKGDRKSNFSLKYLEMQSGVENPSHEDLENAKLAKSAQEEYLGTSQCLENATIIYEQMVQLFKLDEDVKKCITANPAASAARMISSKVDSSPKAVVSRGGNSRSSLLERLNLGNGISTASETEISNSADEPRGSSLNVKISSDEIKPQGVGKFPSRLPLGNSSSATKPMSSLTSKLQSSLKDMKSPSGLNSTLKPGLNSTLKSGLNSTLKPGLNSTLKPAPGKKVTVNQDVTDDNSDDDNSVIATNFDRDGSDLSDSDAESRDASNILGADSSDEDDDNISIENEDL